MLQIIIKPKFFLFLCLTIVVIVIVQATRFLPYAGNVDWWIEGNHNEVRVRWDLRTNITGFAEIRPAGGVSSPDGSQIITIDMKAGQTRLYRTAPDSVQSDLIGRYTINRPIAEIQFSEDGDAVYLIDTLDSAITRIFRIDLQTGEDTLVHSIDVFSNQARWSTDGQFVMLLNQIGQTNPTDAHIVNLAHGVVMTIADVASIQWSETGHKLSYRLADDRHTLIATDAQLSVPSVLTLENENIQESLWSFDNTRLIVATNSSVYLYDIATASKTPIMNSFVDVMGWSTDGRYLVVESVMSNLIQIYDFETESGIPLPDSKLSFGSGYDTGISWSENNEVLVLSQRQANSFVVNVIDVATGNVKNQLNFSTGLYRPVYHNDGRVANWVAQSEKILH